VMIEVRDGGAGIPADVLPRVFEPFVQADRSLERSRGGLGIGLTLVKKIVELHQGQVSAQSEGVGRGSLFAIRLPAIAAAGPVAAPPAPAAAMLVFPVRILVVDDNVDAAESLAMLLQTDGHVVAMAHNGMDAVQRVESWRPDVVVLDIGLPGMNGYEVAQVLRQRDECPALIAVTGYGQAADTRRALDAGFRFHLVKPVDARDLMAAIAQCASTRTVNRASGAA